jgi:hypothetical protein
MEWNDLAEDSDWWRLHKVSGSSRVVAQLAAARERTGSINVACQRVSVGFHCLHYGHLALFVQTVHYRFSD